MRRVLQLIVRERLIFSSVVKALVWWCVLAVQCVVWPVSLLGLLRQKQVCPPVTDSLCLLSATELAKRIRSRQVTCVEVVQVYISRVREVNPLLNAVVQDRFSEALQEARQMDQLLDSGRLSSSQLERDLPLLGVPLTVKETVAVTGMSNSGAWSLETQHVAEKDAEAVRCLRAAGAVVLLVSNTPELCMCWETFNPKFGTTNNPYDTRRTPAGSSGGEAALLGSAASLVSVASDVSGSLRLPAMFTGVYGHKPTPGYISNVGHRPSARDENWDHFFTLGPMCRYAEDLPLMLRTMVSDQSKIAELKLDDHVDLSRIKVFYMEEDGPERVFTDPVSPDIKVAMRKAVTYLQVKHGMAVRQVSVAGLTDVVNYVCFLMLRMKGIPNVFQKHKDNPDEWDSVVLSLVKRMLCVSSASLMCLLYGPLKTIVDSLPQPDVDKLVDKKHHLMNQFKTMLGEDSVFLYPTFPQPAHLHGQILYKFLNTSYLSLFNFLEMPATACPLGLDPCGLPIGIQICAWQKQDRLTLAVASALEKEFGGWIPPCM